MKGDQSVSFRTESGRILKTQVVVQLGFFAFAIVPLLAGDLTGTTADALRNIDQSGFNRSDGYWFRHILRPWLFGTVAWDA